MSICGYISMVFGLVNSLFTVLIGAITVDIGASIGSMVFASNRSYYDDINSDPWI